MTPAQAVDRALNDLRTRADYTVKEVVDLAENYLGEDSGLHMKEFVRGALTKKTHDRLRNRQDAGNSTPLQRDLLGDFDCRRVTIKRDDGEFISKQFNTLKWNGLTQMRKRKLERAHKSKKDAEDFEKVIERLQPQMESQPSITVEEATEILTSNAEAIESV